MTTQPERFWALQSTEEIRTVRALLVRRFPREFAAFSGALEEVDPFEVVYPDQPDEYLYVVMELCVLTAGVNADVRRLSRSALEAVLTAALARCFGEEPPPERVRQVADRLMT